MSTRRKFLQDCATVFAVTALAPLGALSNPPSPSFAMKDVLLDDLSFAMLAGQLNSTFQVQAAPGQTVKLELVEAELKPESAASAGQGRARPQLPDYESFSLMFAGARQEPLPQRIYTFEHSALGRFEMFIVPVGAPDAGRIQYQAVFNRPARGVSAIA
jgi:hypothetical protein